MSSKLEIITSRGEEIENRLTDERGKIARAKKFHKLGYKTREGLEDWQRRNAPQSTGKSEGSGGGGGGGNTREKGKKIKKNSYNNMVPKELS